MPVTKQLIENLARLPTELALDIINDLRVWDVIKLMLRDNPKVNRHLLAHPRCRILLGDDAETLTKTREQVRAYLEFAAQWDLRLCLPHDSLYERSLFDLRLGKLNNPNLNWQIVHTVHSRVWGAFPSSVDELLRPYVKSPRGLMKVTIYSSLEEYKQYWDVMVEAKSALAHKCSGQLLRAAALLEANPDILKRTTDPDQKRRRNTQHVVSRMKQMAEKILRRKAWNFRRVEYFGYEFFPIIPFDSALQYLLCMMEKHRITAGDQIVLAGSQHPSSMVKLAQTVVDGMAYFYALDPARPTKIPRYCATNIKGDVLRTENTPWSDEPKDKDRRGDVDAAARFTPSASTYLPAWGRIRAFDGNEPYSAREEEWVKAFVELYRYLDRLDGRNRVVV